MNDLKKQTERLLALADAVGPSSFATAEISEDGAVDCPLCSGEGYIEAKTAINIDQRAVTMQFYGVGDDFSRYSALWEAVPSMAAHLRALQVELDRLTAENEALLSDRSQLRAALYDEHHGITATLRDDEAEAIRLHAELYRWVRRKFCFTGNGDGTCSMHAINLPARCEGWPDFEQVESFADAVIYAAMSRERG